LEKQICFNLPTGTNFDKLIHKFSQKHTISSTFKKSVKYKIYDTFDWRLFKNNLILLRNNNFFEILLISDNTLLEKFHHIPNQHIKFWWDFPKESTKNRFRAILDVRALTEIVCFNSIIKQYSVLNSDGKTVVRFEYKSFHMPKQKKKINFVNLIPLKGYFKEAKSLEISLIKSGCGYYIGNPILALIKTKDIQPGEYSSQINISLDARMSLHQASVAIFKRLLHIMKANVEGIKADIDSEFLHDFRVAVRKTRSALTLIKDVFSISETDRFRRDFAYVGKKTNKLRDIDVYLIKKNNYEKMLPDKLKLDLTSFFQELEEERRLEHRNLVRFLNSTKFKQILKKWEYFLLEKNDSEKGASSNKFVFASVKKIILERYHRIISIGREITDETPDRVLHQLRIEGKKLRYLLEFFSSLFPSNEMVVLVKQMKRLQDNLGDFNDLAVQQEFLKEYLSKLKNNDQNALKIAAAFGGLIVAFNIKQEKIRDSFKVIFKEFSNKKNKQVYVTLFS
jgi:CHAD domain-containing protein